MEKFVFLIFLLLCFALALTIFRRGKNILKIKIFRLVIVLIALGFYTYWFTQKSVSGFLQDSVSVQVINKLPQSLDFYLVRVNKDGSDSQKFTLKHSGKIRPEHYRLEYLNMDHSDEYWIVGYIGKKNMVYFSQHALPNKNLDQIIEVKNYINQSLKLSETAGKEIDKFRLDAMGKSVWVTLSLLLIFLNSLLLLTRR